MLKNRMMAAALLLALGTITMNAATAHGVSAPRHGGIVQVVNDLNFELVVEADGATIYLVDHDAPMPSQGIAGKLTVLQGSNKSDVELKPAGDNKLRATGVKITGGAKIVAVLTLGEGKTATVRFAVK